MYEAIRKLTGNRVACFSTCSPCHACHLANDLRVSPKIDPIMHISFSTLYYTFLKKAVMSADPDIELH